MKDNYEIKRLEALLQGMGIPNVSDVIADATPDDLRSIGKCHAFLHPNPKAHPRFDLYESTDVRDLFHTVAAGCTSVNKAARMIEDQLPPNDVANELFKYQSRLQEWLDVDMKDYTDKQYGKGKIRKLINDE